MPLVTLRLGDCVERMKEMEPNSINGVVCDPPYGLAFMNKNWDRLDFPEVKAEEDTEATEEEDVVGDKSIETIHAQQAWHLNWIKEAFRVVRSGGVVKAFGGTRTFHRLAAAMADAGFVDLHLEAWVYGSGFPKSLNISKAIDRHLGLTREVIGKKKCIPGVAFETTGPSELDVTAPASPEAKKFEGYGTALKPAWEPFIVGRKP